MGSSELVLLNFVLWIPYFILLVLASLLLNKLIQLVSVLTIVVKQRVALDAGVLATRPPAPPSRRGGTEEEVE